MQVLPQEGRPSRDYAVTVFVVQGVRVAFVYDELAARFAPPAGHIRPEELPGDAAARVALAQTGVPVTVVGESLHPWQSGALERPEGLMVEAVTPNHEHLNLVYFAHPAPGFRPRLSGELPTLRWFEQGELGELELPPQVAGWAALAILRLGRGT